MANPVLTHDEAVVMVSCPGLRAMIKTAAKLALEHPEQMKISVPNVMGRDLTPITFYRTGFEEGPEGVRAWEERMLAALAEVEQKARERIEAAGGTTEWR